MILWEAFLSFGLEHVKVDTKNNPEYRVSNNPMSRVNALNRTILQFYATEFSVHLCHSWSVIVSTVHAHSSMPYSFIAENLGLEGQ